MGQACIITWRQKLD